MTDFARLGIQFEEQGGEKLVHTLDQVAAKAKAADAAADSLAASNPRASSTFGQLSDSVSRAAHEMMEFVRGVRDGMREELALARATREAAGAMNQQAGAANKLNRETSNVIDFHSRAGKMMNRTRYEALNLGRQMADVGVQIGMGMNPLMIAIQQGPQIAEVFATAKAGGASMGAVFGQLGKIILPFVPALLAIGAAATVTFGGAALAVRALNKEHKDLVGQLGLDEAQLKRLKDSGVETSITLGDAFKGTFQYLSTIIDEHTKGVQSFFSRMLDSVTHASVVAIKALVGGFIGGFDAIKAVWKMLPAAIGDAAISATNAVLRAIETMINKAIAGINVVINASRSAEKALGLKPSISTIDPIRVGQVANQYANGAQDTAAAAGRAFSAGMKRGEAFVDRQFNRIDKFITDAAKARIRDAAGDAAKQRAARGRQGAGADQRDTSQEREAQIAQMLAQAHQEELQAQLQLTKDVWKRAAIEKEIAQAELAIKLAQVDRTAASIMDDKGLSDAKKAELMAQLDSVKLTLSHAGMMRQQVIAQNALAESTKQQLDVEMAGRDAHLDLLKSQAGLAQSVLGRWKLEEQILAETQDRQRAELAAQIQIAEARDDAVEAAKLRARGQFLDQIQANERQQLQQSHKVIEIYREIEGKFKSFGDAVDQHDWAGAIDALMEAISTTVESFKKASTVGEKIQSVAGMLSGLGGAIGGSVGGLLKGAGGGISAVSRIGQSMSGFGGILGKAGSFLSTNPIGMIAGGLIGGIASLFGKAKRDQEERRQRENAAAQAAVEAAQKVADERRQLELRLLDQTDMKLQALAAKREYELSTINEANQALAKQVYDAEDRMRRYDLVYDAELKFLDLSGDKVGKLARERAEENKAIDATLIPLMDLRRAAEDAADALAQAKSDLQAAYDAEMDRLQQQLADAQQRLADIQNQLSDAQSALSSAESQLSDAHDALSQAYDREAGTLLDLISRFKDFGTSLRAFRKSLDVSTPGLSPENAYRAAQSQYADVKSRAQLGDEAAMADFQSVAQNFLEASQAYNGVGMGFQADLADVKLATERTAAVADRTVSNAEAQLDQLKALVNGYIKVDGDVLSVRDAIRGLETAQQAVANAQAQVNAINAQVAAQQATVSAIGMQIDATRALVEPLLGIRSGVMSLNDAIANYHAVQAANNEAIRQLGVAISGAKANEANQPAPVSNTGPGYRSTNGDYGAYVQGQQDLLSLFQSNGGMAKGRTIQEFGLYHWANFGQYENRSVRPYARGGEFMVGGAGGTDSQDVAFRASPDEHVTVKTPEQMAAETEAQAQLADAVHGLGERLDQLVREAKADKSQRVAQTQALTAKLNEVVDAVDGVKRSVRQKAA